MTQIIIVKDKREAEMTAYTFVNKGYDIEVWTENQIILKKVYNGRWYWHLLWFILFPVIGNILYWLYARFIVSEKVIIKRE